MFKTRSVFTHITESKLSILTACISGEKNVASAGNTNLIFFENAKNFAVVKDCAGIASEDFMNNEF